jgi:hypothetical protein
MCRAASIHIGVNQPRAGSPGHPLQHSEETAWKMAGLARQAGYRSVLVLQGDEATRDAVHDTLTGAVRTLGSGDTLFVSFSGHGTQQPDDRLVEQDERDNLDEGWCLYDSVLLDDTLAGYWRLFKAGVRIVLVTESCYGGGMGRLGDEPVQFGSGLAGVWPAAPPPPVYRGGPAEEETAPDPAAPCITRAPCNPDGIRASVLLLSACREDQRAQDGMFSRHLFGLWNDGAFPGSFCELYRQLHKCVMGKQCAQEPRIQLLGAADPRFSLERAFHLTRSPSGQHTVYR